MADGEGPGDNGAEEKLKLTIKAAQRSLEVELSVDATVKELKELISEKLEGDPLDQLCLIFAGRILKDSETLVSQGVKGGVALHLVIRQGAQKPSDSTSSRGSTSSAPSASTGGASPRPAPQAAGFGPPFPGLFGAGGTGQGGLGSGDLARMQQQLMSNPELMQQMLESPMMQSLMSNPDALQSVLTSNPQIQELMERNPELTHILHNPELMRQAMEMARNPAAMRELMRSQDRQLSNIENLPGGFNALARMYTEIQEPMMDAAQESLQQQLNPFSALFQPRATPNPGPSAPQGTTNTSPLPNPWAPTSSTPSTSGTSSSSAATGSQSSGARSTPAGSTPAGASGSGPAVGGASGGYQAYLQEEMERLRDNPEEMQRMMQMSQAAQSGNPELLTQMMSSPAVQGAMEQMMNDPRLMEQMLQNHPLMAGNPQAGAMAQQAAQMMQRNEFRQMMSNPQALQAMMQIQQGMTQLQQTAPGVVAQSFQSSGATPTAGGTGGSPGAGPGQVTQDQLQQALSSVIPPASGGSSSQGGTAPQPPPHSVTPPTTQPSQQGGSRVRLYQAEMEQLQAMGFMDRQANLRALIDSGGDVGAAVNRLLE